MSRQKQGSSLKPFQLFYSGGLGFAAAASWTANGSFWWAVVHGTLSWVYIAYLAMLQVTNACLG